MWSYLGYAACAAPAEPSTLKSTLLPDESELEPLGYLTRLHPDSFVDSTDPVKILTNSKIISHENVRLSQHLVFLAQHVIFVCVAGILRWQDAPARRSR
jgi:hypothetical protein